MSTVVTFGNRNIVEPGVYSQSKANVTSNPLPFSAGNVLIIDTGEGGGIFGGGSGIDGELSSGLDSIYGFDSLSDFRQFVRGGLLWDLAEYLFIPVNGSPGAPRVYLVRAAKTTAATISYYLNTGGPGGVFIVKCKNEGGGGNGINPTFGEAKVRYGYAAQLKKGVIDSSKYYMEFTEGTFKGYDDDSEPYDGQDISLSEPIVVARSPEFISLKELISWTKTDNAFNARFVLDPSTTTIGDGNVSAAHYMANKDLKLAEGGDTTYSVDAYDKVLSTIGELDYTFVLSLKNDYKAMHAENPKLLYHITEESEFKRFMIVGGGNDELKFDQAHGSIEIAKFFDSANAIVCHSGFKEKLSYSTQKKNKSSLYHAALVCGRLAGLQPQNSGTFKTLRAKEWNHQLTQSQREVALQAGVLHNRYVPNLGFVINQAINTLQRNTQMINPDGTSSEISIMRIAEQLNKELVLNMRPIFVGQNINTASPADIKAWIEGYLSLKTATRTQDNLIIRFEKVSVKQVQDYYEISYCFVPNSPINKLFITGFILDANLTA